VARRATRELHSSVVETVVLAPPPRVVPSPAPTILARGTRIGPYEIITELGRGGMGVVYRARDVRLQRDVALKTISGNVDRERLERFVREARAAARLRHPGVVQVLGVETHPVCAVAFELVEGGSLADRLRASGPLAAHTAATMMRDLAYALHEAHRHGIVHRDVKPANILLDDRGSAKLADFGAAHDELAAEITASGALVGTPCYMAPEQADGDRGAIGPWTDVYGLGAVLYEALAGQMLFEGSKGITVLIRVLHEEPAPPSVPRVERGKAPVPRDLETVCLKALEKDPARRYESAKEFARDLDRFLEGEPVVARPIGAVRQAWRRLRRQNRFATLLAVSFGLAALVTPTLLALDHAREASLRVAAARDDLAESEARIAAIESDARTIEFEARGDHARVLRDGTLTLVAAQNAARIVSTTAANRVVLGIDITLAAEALRYEQIGLTGYALIDARNRLVDATPAQRDALGKLGNALWIRPSVEKLHFDGVSARNDGDRAAAERAFDHALELDPDYTQSLYMRGVIRYERDELRGALSDLERVVALEPRWSSARAGLAMALDACGQKERSLVEAERAVALRPQPYAFYVRGLLRDSREDLEEVIRRQPDGTYAHQARDVLAKLPAITAR
jgi:tetratricopeptide (TPR) repeat protein/tRNA A-37 threonylcarbamoyl transferase component Bud32